MKMRRVASDPETGIGAPFSGGFELANLILKIPFGISAELPLRHVETAALGLCVHVTDVIGNRLFFFLQPLDTFPSAPPPQLPGKSRHPRGVESRSPPAAIRPCNKALLS